MYVTNERQKLGEKRWGLVIYESRIAEIKTGEGKFDKQSLEGKVISGIVNMAKSKKARVLVVAGYSEIDMVEGVEKVFSCTEEVMDINEIKRTCVINLKNATKKIYEYLK